MAWSALHGLVHTAKHFLQLVALLHGFSGVQQQLPVNRPRVVLKVVQQLAPHIRRAAMLCLRGTEQVGHGVLGAKLSPSDASMCGT
jgi:hypothetical protein